MNISKWYIVRLFRNSKMLFAILSLFCAIQLFINHKKIHVSPWFVWDMYSKVEQVPDTLIFTQFYANENLINYLEFPFWTFIGIDRSTTLYDRLKKNDEHDPLKRIVDRRFSALPKSFQDKAHRSLLNSPDDIAAYPEWLRSELEKQLKTEVRKLEAIKMSYTYNDGKYTFAGFSDTILSYQIQ